MSHQARCQHWTAVLSDQAASGLSKKDFCSVHGIKVATFYYWQRQLREVDSEVNVSGFTPIELVDEHELSIQCAGRWIVLRSISLETLAGVVKTLADA
ncbi:MAG: hypothetical protein AAGA62_16095 [Bacteroidota bacterium]